jgi:hypothetical protein
MSRSKLIPALFFGIAPTKDRNIATGYHSIVLRSSSSYNVHYAKFGWRSHIIVYSTVVFEVNAKLLRVEFTSLDD